MMFRVTPSHYLFVARDNGQSRSSRRIYNLFLVPPGSYQIVFALYVLKLWSAWLPESRQRDLVIRSGACRQHRGGGYDGGNEAKC